MRLALPRRTGFSATLGATERSVASGPRRREWTEWSCCAGDWDCVVVAVTCEARAASVVPPTPPLDRLGRSAGGRRSLCIRMWDSAVEGSVCATKRGETEEEEKERGEKSGVNCEFALQ